MSNFEEKYLKALRSIEEILKANRQIKDELDVLRSMRQAEIDSFTNVQKEEFRKAYDTLLQDKNSLAIRNQTLELQNERLKLAQNELEIQLADTRKNITPPDSPLKADSREAELRRTIENYEEHHATLQKNCRRLEERNGQLQAKLLGSEKSWRNKLEAKDLEIVEVKARARQEYGQQLNALRKENAAFKLANGQLQSKLENCQQVAIFGQQLQAQDWEGELLRQLTAVRSSLDPLRQQVTELQQADNFQREGEVRQRASLQARVLQLQAEAQKNAEIIKSLEKRLLEGQQAQAQKNFLSEQIRKLEEQNQLLNGRIIVMQSREITLRSRSGEQLQQRVLQFESRIDLLLSNKEGLRELREVGIHQLIALKAYILELDSRLKELMLSNGYILKKYKSYKEKYQASLKENKQLAMTINTLKMKMMGYDQLVLKLQTELEAALKVEPLRETKTHKNDQEDLFRRKYQLLLQKLQVQEKYKSQQVQTLKIGYETRIVELTIKAEEVKSFKETIDLYKKRNQQLQNQLTRKDDEISESKVLTHSKVANEQEGSKQSRDMIASLHATIKAHQQTIFRLQTELRSKQQSTRRGIRKLQKELEDAKEHYSRDLARKDLDYSINLDQQVKRYKLRVAELENANQFGIVIPFDKGEGDSKVRNLQKRLESAEAATEQQVFNRRRVEKQLLDITQDYQQLQRSHNELELKLNQLRNLQRNYQDLKEREGGRKTSGDYLDFQLQSKDAIIKRLNYQIQELKQALSAKPSTPITHKNQVFYLKKQIEQLKDALSRHNKDNSSFKTTIQTSRTKLNNELQSALQEKEALISRLRRDLTMKQNKLLEFEEEASKLTEQIRRFKRELTEIDKLRSQINRLETALIEKQRIIQQLRAQESSYDVQLDRIKQELVFVKQNYQRINYESLEKTDQISRLTLEIKTVAARTTNQLNTQYAQQIEVRETQYSRLSAELSALRGTIRTLEEETRYREQNQRKANNGVISLRYQNEQLKEQNESLRNQLYSLTKQVGQMRINLSSYKRQAQQQHQRQQQNYLIKTEFFTLKSDISNLHQQLFTKQSLIARMNNQLSFLKTSNSQMEEQLYSLRQYNSRITFEYNTLRQQHTQLATTVNEKTDTLQSVNTELFSVKNQKRQLQDDMQYMNNNYIVLSQQLTKTKANLASYQEEIQSKIKQSSKLLSQIQNLRSEAINLNELLSEKQAEINKLRQQLVNVRFQTNQREYEQKLRMDRQIYAYNSKISSLLRDIDEKDAQIKRLQKNSYRPESPTVDFQAQELRIQLERAHHQLLNIRKENSQYRYELQRLHEVENSQQRQIVEINKKLHTQKQQIEKSKQEVEVVRIQLRAKNQQIINLSRDIQVKNQHLQQMNQQNEHYRQQFLIRQNQFNQIAQQINKNAQLNYKMIIKELQNKLNTHISQLKHCQVLIKQYERKVQQYEHRIVNQSHQLQQLIRAKNNYQATIQDLHIKHSQEISQIRIQLTSQTSTSVRPSISGLPIKAPTQSIEIETTQEDHSLLIHPYLEEIDRLNNIIRVLQQDLAAFKLKLSSMIIHENRIEQNLNVMMKIFNEVTSVGKSIQIRQAQIGEVRRSFVQKADSESGRSSPGQQRGSSKEIQQGQSVRSSLQSSSVQEGQQQSRSGMISIKINASSQPDIAIHHPPPGQNLQSQFTRQVRHIQHSVQGQYIIQGGSLGQSNIVRHSQNIVTGPSVNDNQIGRRY